MRKIGELKGKPIVEGNPNEVKNNQIHAKTEGENITLSERKNGSLETISGSSSGGSSKYAPRYFSIDWDKANEIWVDVFYAGSTHIRMQPFSTVKVKDNSLLVITAYGNPQNNNSIKAFSYIPCYIDEAFANEFSIPHSGILTFEQCIEVLNVFLNMSSLPQISLDGITEITEEEYYKID